MSSIDSSELPSTTDWTALKGAVKRFEDAWRSGPRPAIDDHLTDDSLRSRLLVELVHIDLELRLKAGESARAEEYLARYAELAGNRSVALDLIAAEYELRRRFTPRLSLDDYLRRFPEYRHELPGRVAAPTVVGESPARDTPSRHTDLTPEMPPAVPGYEILGLLGRGGMGVVYKARQKSLGRLVALKFLPADCVRDALWLDRFHREAVTASALNHPHICTIYDTGEAAGRPYLSMELVQGRTLAALTRKGLPARELARVFRQAAAALAAAAAAGVVHRDIKPENLMLRDDGILKVLDFGLARRLSITEDAAGGVATAPGVRVGTVLYMSPEQARGQPPGPAGDVFSLGLVLYEVATGRHPFPGESEIAILYAICVDEPAPPGRLNPELGPALSSLIERMLRKDPRLRPDAGQVESELAALAEVTPLAADLTSASARAPVVGRALERQALDEAFAAVAAGRGQVVCIAGEPGLGKTTLAEQFLADLAAAGRVSGIARGRCSERLAASEAYLPLLEALESLIRGDDGPAMARQLKAVAPTWYVHVAPLDDDSVERLAERARASSQERMKRELLAFCQEASRSRPLVLFLDDLHWVDACTVDLLSYLGARTNGLRLLVLVTYRPTELLLGQHPFVPVQLELKRHGVCRDIALRFLSRGDVENYLSLVLAEHRLPPEFIDLIHAKTEGNSLFLVDLLRYLQDRGVIAAGAQGWALTQTAGDYLPGLPESVRSMIQKKIGLLRKPDLRLLSAASVQGYRFDSTVVARVLGIDPATAEEHLAALERVHGMVRLRKQREFPDGTPTLRYQFVHVLYQNALYEGIQPSRRTAWSSATARVLQNLHGVQAEAIANELACLFEAGGEPGPAVDQFLQAARGAVRVFAHREAIALARRGLVLLQKLPETPERDRQEVDLYLTLGVSLVATRGFAAAEVEENYSRARTLCQRYEDVPTLFRVMYGLWNVYLVRGELARCLELATQMQVLVADQTDPVLRLQAHNVVQQPLYHRGDLQAARRHQEEALALYDRCRDRPLSAEFGEDPGVGCRLYGAMTLWQLGYPEQALQSARAGRSLAKELRNPFDIARALYFEAFTYLYRREPASVRRVSSALVELCREQGFAQLFAGGTVLRGWSLTEQGRTEEGVAQMRKGLAAWQATGALAHRPYLLALLGEAVGRIGRVAEGLRALDEALVLCTTTEERYTEAELHRLRGELFRQQPDPDRAETSFREALAVARRQEARAPELRAALSLGRLLCARGHSAEARRQVADIYGWFTEGFDTADLQDARAFLESLPTPPRGA
jgi:predicted ATPase